MHGPVRPSITSITQKASSKHPILSKTSSTLHASQKSPQEIARQLQNDLRVARAENEDLRLELEQVTQLYLTLKKQSDQHKLWQQVNSLPPSASMDLSLRDSAITSRTVNQLVEERIAKKEKKFQTIIDQLKSEVDKLRNQKVCLAKNVLCLQDRLKDTRGELRITQQQLVHLQNLMPQSYKSGNERSVNTSEGSGKSSMLSGGLQSRKRFNKVMNFDPQSDNKKSESELEMKSGQKPQEEEFQPNPLHQKRQHPVRNGLLVARSLAVVKGERNYEWLFTEDESPTPGLMKDESQKNGKIVGKGEREILQTIPYSETLHSNRTNIEDSLLSARDNSFLPQDSHLKPERPSLVMQSLKNVQSIIRRAADGLRASQGQEWLGRQGGQGREEEGESGVVEVDHKSIEFEMGGWRGVSEKGVE